MTNSRYYDFAESEGLTRRHEVFRDFRTYVNASDSIQWFFSDEYFTKLNDRDKARSASEVSAIQSGEEWKVALEYSDEGLFSTYVPRDRIAATAIDAYVLSGAAGADVMYGMDEESSKSIDLNLDELRLLGAIAINKKVERDTRGWREITTQDGESTTSVVRVGADLNGDFRMTTRHINGTSSISPGGEGLPFAPSETEMIMGYHSTEKEIIDTLIEHLAINSSESEKQSLYDEISTSEKWGQSGFSSNPFADYGVNKSDFAFLRPWDKEYDGIRSGVVVDELGVFPGSHSVKLQILSEAKGIRFRQASFCEGVATYGPQLFIPDEDVVELVKAIGLSDQGRTSPLEIDILLRMRLLGESKKEFF